MVPTIYFNKKNLKKDKKINEDGNEKTRKSGGGGGLTYANIFMSFKTYYFSMKKKAFSVEEPMPKILNILGL